MVVVLLSGTCTGSGSALAVEDNCQDRRSRGTPLPDRTGTQLQIQPWMCSKAQSQVPERQDNACQICQTLERKIALKMIRKDEDFQDNATLLPCKYFAGEPALIVQ